MPLQDASRRAADLGYAPRFLSFCVALSFSRFGGEAPLLPQAGNTSCSALKLFNSFRPMKKQRHCKFVWIVSVLFLVAACSSQGTSFPLTSPSSTSIAQATPTFAILATPTMATQTALAHPTNTSTPSWVTLPKGLYLFFQYDDREGLYALSISDHQVTQVLDQDIRSAVGMPDNRHVMLLDGPERILLDLQNGSRTTVQIPQEFAEPYFLAFSPVNEDIIWVAGDPLHTLPINGDGSFLYYFQSSNNLKFHIQGSWPVWSPDGKYVAYEEETYASPPMSMTVPYADITLLAIPCEASDAEPCHTLKLTNSSLAREARKPSWSPDSQLLAYECSTTTYDEQSDAPQDIFTVAQDICTIRINGSGFKQLTDTEDVFEGHPLWSPVDDLLVFAGALSQYEPNDLYLLNVKTEEISNLTNTADLSEIPLFWWDNR